VADAPRVRFLRHHEEDDPGLVGAAFARLGYACELMMVDDATPPIDLDGVDVLSILGSKWSVYDHDAVGGWISTELDAIGAADAADVPVLGICFGAQALCTALGGAVEPMGSLELGWVDLPAHEAGVPAGPWFEYHFDRCRPPDGAEVLVANERCVQAFRVGRHLGVQFHPEIDAGQLGRWYDAGARVEVAASGLDPAELLARTAALEADAAARTDRLVEAFLAAAR